MIMNAYDVTYNMTMIHDHNLQKNLKADPSVESKSSFFHLSQENQRNQGFSDNMSDFVDLEESGINQLGK